MGILKTIETLVARAVKSFLPKTREDRIQEVTRYFENWKIHSVALPRNLVDIEQAIGSEMTKMGLYIIAQTCAKGTIDSQDISTLLCGDPIFHLGLNMPYERTTGDIVLFYTELSQKVLNSIN